MDVHTILTAGIFRDHSHLSLPVSMQAPSSSTLTLLTLSPLIVWRIYARLRKMFGRQRLSRYRALITLAVLWLTGLLWRLFETITLIACSAYGIRARGRFY